MVNDNFSSITDIDVRFSPNPRHPQMHKWLNQIYQDALPDHHRIFDDPTDPKTVLPKDPLLALLRTIIIQEMIIPYAHETENDNCIAPLIQKAALQISCDKSATRRLTSAHLIKALEHARGLGLSSVTILIDTSCFYLRSLDNVSYLNWNVFTTNSADAALAPYPASPHVDATPVTIQSPPQDYTAMAIAMASAFQQIRIGDPLTSTDPATPERDPRDGRTFSNDASSTFYCPVLLPDDVRIRYDAKFRGDPITQTMVHQPFSNGHLYYLDGTERIVLADGTLFSLREPDEKAALREPIYCTDDTYAGIRKWYNLFTRQLMAKGFYAHPIWCFRKDHGGNWGFSAGEDATDDLPKRLELSLPYMSNTIYRLLQKNEMFPRDSSLRQIVQACYGDGFYALKSILLDAHPVFHDHPAVLITTYPSQSKMSLLEYYQLFLDYLQLRAFVKNIPATLNDPDELDVFISRSTHKDYLMRVTREERRTPSLAHKYTGPQLLETLKKLLNAPDSPTRLIANSPPPSSFRSSPPFSLNDTASPPHHENKFKQYKTKRVSVNPIASEPTDDSMESLVEAVYSIKCPDDPVDRKLMHMYTASINQIKQQPSTAHSTTCLVCQGQHRFEHCPVLNDSEFLRGHYIRFCQHVNNDTKQRQRLPSPHHQVPVNYLFAVCCLLFAVRWKLLNYWLRQITETILFCVLMRRMRCFAISCILEFDKR